MYDFGIHLLPFHLKCGRWGQRECVTVCSVNGRDPGSHEQFAQLCLLHAEWTDIPKYVHS